jgi:hypothetical protein
MLDWTEFIAEVEAVILLGCAEEGFWGLFLEDRSVIASLPLRGRRVGGIVMEFRCL